MIMLATWFGIGCFALGLMANLWRLLRGPALSDRLAAFDMAVLNLLVLLVLYAKLDELHPLMDGALLLALAGPAIVLTLCRAASRGGER